MTKSLKIRDNVLVRKRNKMAALENILDEAFVCRFLMEENNSYEDLLVLSNQEPLPKSIGLQYGLQSIGRICSYHDIKKRTPVADGTVDIAVQGAISEVRLCCKSNFFS